MPSMAFLDLASASTARPTGLRDVEGAFHNARQIADTVHAIDALAERLVDERMGFLAWRHLTEYKKVRHA